MVIRKSPPWGVPAQKVPTHQTPPWKTSPWKIATHKILTWNIPTILLIVLLNSLVISLIILRERISGVLLGSIVGPIILFNAFLNYFFHGIENVSVHNFADDNTLSCFGQTVKDLTQQTFVGLQDVWKMSSRHVLKTSSTRLQRNSFLSSNTSSA